MGKTALVTGASGGIGLEFAYIHASKGDDLVLIARNNEKLEALKADLETKYKIQVYNIIKDLSLATAPKEVFDELKQKGISIDYLINNAGIGDFGLFHNSDWGKQEQMINLNITALTYFTRLFLPEMIERGEGRILNVASTASFQPGPTMSVYFASKAFVLNFSEAINNEVSDKGVTVTALCPGSTESGFHAVTMGDSKLVKKRKRESARSVAEYGYNAMMKGKSLVIPGLKNKILAGLIRFAPRSIVVKMARRVQTRKHL